MTERHRRAATAAPLLVALLLAAPGLARTEPPRQISITRHVPVPPEERADTKLVGIATWYDAERHGGSSWYTRAGLEWYGAAGPALRRLVPHRYGERYRILLTAKATGRTLVVWVTDSCSCLGRLADPKDDRLIDLAPAVWEALGVPLSRGIQRVEIELLDRD